MGLCSSPRKVTSPSAREENVSVFPFLELHFDGDFSLSRKVRSCGGDFLLLFITDHDIKFFWQQQTNPTRAILIWLEFSKATPRAKIIVFFRCSGWGQIGRDYFGKESELNRSVESGVTRDRLKSSDDMTLLSVGLRQEVINDTKSAGGKEERSNFYENYPRTDAGLGSKSSSLGRQVQVSFEFWLMLGGLSSFQMERGTY
ncbi:hypothetical protein Tco_0859181 [Tanacetum coccineum]|uniref:Uncharacterized protein n=1 Tax=Tanacetum coccineum TaxID=301880 RepID=A0ABQ5BD20_9ASTR